MVKDGSLGAIPVLDEALGDLGDSETDGLSGSRDLDDAFGRLGEHVLRSDHASAGDVLDLTDLGSTLTDDGADEEMGDQETDGGGAVGGDSRGIRGPGGGDGVLENGLGDKRVGLLVIGVSPRLKEGATPISTHLGDALDGSSDGEDSVGDSGNDLGHTGLDTELGAESGDGSSTTADDNTCESGEVSVDCPGKP